MAFKLTNFDAALTPSGNDGYALTEVGGVLGYRPIKEAWIVPAFAINSFFVTGAVKEVGESVVTPAFTATYNRPPTLAELDDNDGNPTKDVTSTPTAFSSDGTFQKTANNATVLFTLSAEEDGEADSANATMYWRPRTFYGVSSSTGPYDEAFIEALSNSQLDNNRNTVFTQTAGVGEYIFYAYPQVYGAGTFFVGGFEGGFSSVGIISVTNAYGVSQLYYLYRSDNPNLGTTTVTVT